MNISSFSYRKELDGLRALAIIPVVFYHAGISFFSGGFVGVDVFFVISGYLITNIILSDIEKKKFTFRNFYERRARRILPALVLVSLICIPFSFFLFKDIYLLEFVRSLVSIIFFSSNFLFWSESGYFSTQTEFKPLIHTWSLSVEEQYYIIFPLIFIFFLKFFKSYTKIFFIFLLCFSFILCIWGSFHFPNATFYLLPFRGWEIILGVLTAIFLKENNKRIKRIYNELFSIFGFILILGSIIFLNSNSIFPGYNTIFPTIGTVLLIVFCRENTILFKIFTFKYLVSLGLISYSLYLWHQPILAFTKFYYLNEISTLFKLSAILISIIISYFCWNYVEQPFRNKKKISIKIFSLLLFFIIIIFSVTWAYTIKYSNFNNIYLQKPEVLKNNKKIEYFISKFKINSTSEDIYFDSIKPLKKKISKRVLVLGDSHAQSYNLMGEYYADKYGIEWHSYIFQGCPPIFGYYKIYNIEQTKPSKKQNNCKQQVRKWEKFVKKNGEYFDYIILASRWNYIFNHNKYENKQYRKDALVNHEDIFLNNKKILSKSRDNFKIGLKYTIEAINKSGSNAIIFSQPPLLIRNPIRCMGISKLSYSLCANASYNNIINRGFFVKETILNENMIDNKKNFYLILEDHLCDHNRKNCFSKKGKKLLYKDDDHLSYEGVYLIAKEWELLPNFPLSSN